MYTQLAGFPVGIHETRWLNRDVWLIEQPWGQLVVAKLGAQILHYQPTGHQPVFWVNPQNVEDNNQPLRGGVPICWPWFGPNVEDGSLPSHGFARIRYWHLVSAIATSQDDKNTNESDTVLLFEPNEALDDNLALQFELRISTNDLCMRIITKNMSAQPQILTQAIHSYFKVGNSEEIVIKGLQHSDYVDTLNNDALETQLKPLQEIKAVDRIYKHSGTSVIEDKILTREIVISKINSQSTVVWHPGDKAINYAIAQHQRDFICVEAANTSFEKITLMAQETVSLSQQVVVNSLL